MNEGRVKIGHGATYCPQPTSEPCPVCTEPVSTSPWREEGQRYLCVLADSSKLCSECFARAVMYAARVSLPPKPLVIRISGQERTKAFHGDTVQPHVIVEESSP